MAKIKDSERKTTAWWMFGSVFLSLFSMFAQLAEWESEREVKGNRFLFQVVAQSEENFSGTFYLADFALLLLAGCKKDWRWKKLMNLKLPKKNHCFSRKEMNLAAAAQRQSRKSREKSAIRLPCLAASATQKPKATFLLLPRKKTPLSIHRGETKMASFHIFVSLIDFHSTVD